MKENPTTVGASRTALLRWAIFAVIAVVILVGDQISKAWISSHYRLGVSVPVLPPTLYIYHTTNDGVAWSLFRGHTDFFSLVAVVFSVGILVVAQPAMRRSTMLAIATGLLLGGSIGNLVDRIRLHRVVDFIDVHIGSWYQWPTFNVADSAITTGMVLLAIYFWVVEPGAPASVPQEESRDATANVDPGERGVGVRDVRSG
ncbi:MAG TPA: signal peptidase II [Armatimonadota bacterium]|nr:signal peptidase II [Armatimonadota bacterium]